MHGSIFLQLKEYVEQKLGKGSWNKLLQAAGFEPNKTFLATNTYSDADIQKLVDTGVKITGISAAALLEDFGLFLGGYLLKSYSVLVDPSWSTLEFLEKTEPCIHKALKASGAKVAPPEISSERISPKEVVIHYNSYRRMCHLAVGIIKAVAKSRGEAVTVRQKKCMHLGDPACEIVVTIP